VAARLSRIRQGHDGADRIERDDEAAQKWAERNGRRIIHVCEDRGVSGASDPFKRKGLGPWLTDPVRMAQYDEVLVSSIDRLARKFHYLVDLQRWADENGKRITVLEPALCYPYGEGDITSMILWTNLGTFAEIERLMTEKRYKDARQTIEANGGHIGKAPFGFEITGDTYSKTLSPDDRLKPYVKEMVRRVLKDETLRSIARYLDAEGVLTVNDRPRAAKGERQRVLADGPLSGRWSSTSVGNVLRSRDLYGEHWSDRRKDKKTGEVLEPRKLLEHKPIIEKDEWLRVQRVLTANKYRRGKQTGEQAMLTGSLFCGVCGGPMYRHFSGKSHDVAYYRCKGTEQVHSMCRNSIRLSLLDEWVNQWFLLDHSEIIATEVLSHANDHTAEIEDLKQQAAQLAQEFTPGADERLIEVRKQIAKLLREPEQPAEVVKRPTGEMVGEVWARLDDRAKLTYLTTLGVKVHVFPLGSRSTEGGRWEMGENVAASPGWRHQLWIDGPPPNEVSEALRHIILTESPVAS